MIRVLFVCLGNICRSPIAEAVFARQVRDAGLEHEIEADSAGTGDWHVGKLPHHGTRQILAQKGVSYDHRARQILASDLERFDYVITMDNDNFRAVREIGEGKAIVRPFLSYAPSVGVTQVPDPYYSGNFDEVYGMAVVASEGLLSAIRRERGL
jgi:protein-tyrosine phosphatase